MERQWVCGQKDDHCVTVNVPVSTEFIAVVVGGAHLTLILTVTVTATVTPIPTLTLRAVVAGQEHTDYG